MQELKDTQSEADTRNISIDRVGVKGLRFPIQIQDKLNRIQSTVATVSLAVDLPDTEIVSIAMHIITAENEVGDMHSTILTAKVISELSAIVEHGMEIQLNKESFSYSRFCMHLRYLVQRMMHGSPLNAGNAMDSIFVTMRNEYPQVYACVQQIDTFLHGTYGWQCSKEEQLYLIMHIHRVCVERAED